jgi:hypothetical protein
MGGKSGNKRVNPYSDKYTMSQIKKTMSRMICELEMEQFRDNIYLYDLQNDYSFFITIPQHLRTKEQQEVVNKFH